ncbi:hypothetical protein [Arthrobacter sp. 2MCAF14]|uniref:hypothetical protein n=1 Tax=Arthrobacter sp. 2MCAF14 TaxID=3232982 RepID=UPI003F8E57ED
MLVSFGTGTGLREVVTGVARLPGESLEPVVIAAGPAGLDPDLDAALPLLTRRRQVFVAGAHVWPGELPDRFVLLVAPGCETLLAADARVSALIVLGSASPALDVRCPVLVIAPTRLPAADPATVDVRFAEAGHPAEQAYLIDAFLREPRRYPAGSTIPRARP